MANQTNSMAHTKWMCKYHIVFTPKYRRKVIYNQYKEDIRDIIKTLCKYKGVEIIEGHLMPDHIHMLVSIPPKYSISQCELNGIRPLVERSRSGKGAHVWIFFKKAIPAATARNFGFLLLDKGSTSINLKSFHYYDRMYPSQDVASSIGNLIALPLQGQALKNGNSAFVDENWNAY